MNAGGEATGRGTVDVVGVGECSLDHAGRLERLPHFAQKAELEALGLLPGGQIATALAACARLGLRAALVSAVGDDEAGRRILAPLRDLGVDVGAVRVLPGVASRQAVVLVESTSGERLVLGFRPEGLRLEVGDVPGERIRAARALLVDATFPEAAGRAAREARAAGVPVIADLDRPGSEAWALLEVTDYPIVPRAFARALSPGGHLRKGLEAMLERGARAAVATLNHEGAVALTSEGEAFRVPGIAVAVRDTTGAGDVFHGAFAWALIEGHPLARCLELANAAAALSCEGIGAQGRLPGRAEIERLSTRGRVCRWEQG